MMIGLLLLIVVLAFHSIALDGGMEGLKFYLVPDLQRMKDAGILETVVAAMNQAFFHAEPGDRSHGYLRQLY